MPTPPESANLILKLFDLRREPVLREARAWFVWEFNPATYEEVTETLMGEKSAWCRMVISYWDMAASLVVFEAIDQKMFIAASGELLAVFCKIEPFLAQMREQSPDNFRHLEEVARQFPDAETRLPQMREQFRAMAAARKTQTS